MIALSTNNKYKMIQNRNKLPMTMFAKVRYDNEYFIS